MCGRKGSSDVSSAASQADSLGLAPLLSESQFPHWTNRAHRVVVTIE